MPVPGHPAGARDQDERGSLWISIHKSWHDFSISVPVGVVQIREMRVSVNHFLVTVDVQMRFRTVPGKIMLVLVM